MRQQQLRWLSTALSHCCTHYFRRDLDPGGFSSTGGIFHFKDMTEAFVWHGCEAWSVTETLGFSIWLHLVLWMVTQVSEEHTASVFRATLEKPVFFRNAGPNHQNFLCYIPETHNVKSHCRENSQSRLKQFFHVVITLR